MKFVSCLLLVAFLFPIGALAKSEPPITQLWPPEKPALKLTFDKFRQQGSYGGQNSYQSDVAIENLTDKLIPRAFFTVYFFNREKIRIGQGTLLVADLDAHQTAKMQFQFNSIGVPSSLTLSAKREMLGAKTISLRVVSVPPGAALKVDGETAGTTPVMVRLTVGTHQLDLVKEGYAPGATSIDVTADELPGGSITVELGGRSRDTVELRDGTIVLGDVISMTMTEVIIRVEGKDQSFSRNLVKKIMLVERVITGQTTVIQTGPANPK